MVNMNWTHVSKDELHTLYALLTKVNTNWKSKSGEKSNEAKEDLDDAIEAVRTLFNREE